MRKCSGELKEFINDTEEDLHAKIEDGARAVLGGLRRGDFGVLSNDEAVGTFLHFLCVQYLRTKKMREKVSEILRSVPRNPLAESTSGLLSHVVATTLSFTLSSRRDDLAWTLLRAPPNTRFITTDQPLINLAAVDTPAAEFPEHFDLFYPLSPQWALLLEAMRDKRGNSIRDLSAVEVITYNSVLFQQMNEMAFAQRSADLQTLLSPGDPQV